MALRASSLQSTNTLAINREIGSQYDVVLEVSKHLAEIDTLANEDISGLIDSLNDAKDFTGIMVVTGETPSWDATNKILTVPVEKGDAGTDGRGIANIELTSTVGLTKTYTINYTDATSSTFTVINGANGANGVAGKSVYQLWLDAGNVGTLNDFLEAMKGPKGSTGPQGIGIQGPAGVDGQDLTVEQIGYNGDGTFTWQFSDGTSYTTPDMRGPQGATGQKGDTGQGVHHIKGTSTTNPNGDFGTSPFKDTYTLYGDAGETINLGYFTVTNGISDGMSMEVYDTNGNGIVDNSERLGGILAADVFAEIDLVQDNLDAHTNRVDNPHSVTKAQVGLGNVDNTADATKNVLSATKWTTARTLSLTGAVTGSVSIDGSGNVSLATTHTADTVITLTGDVTGSGTMTNLGSVSITATVADDSHNHIISNVDGLQTALDSKLGASANAVSATKLQTARTIAGVSFDGTADISIPFSGISSKPTTASDYGITDVYTKTENDASLALKVSSSEKGAASGIATLDANGKVALTQIPDSVLGQLEYMGIWNLTTFPTATQKGQYWIASSDGNGYITGDWAVWNGTSFDKVDNTDAVATVAGRTGNVVLTKNDVGLSNVDNTSDANKPVSTAQQTALNLKANIASPTFTGTVTAPTFSGSLSGNADTATKLQTARTINGVSFDGSSNITIADSTKLPTAGGTMTGAITFAAGQTWPTFNQSTTGNAGTATTLQTARTIGASGDVTGTATSFNGSADIIIPMTLSNSGVTAGTYDNVTVDVKGRVTSATSNDSANISALVI